jgi:hypothetical protein
LVSYSPQLIKLLFHNKIQKKPFEYNSKIPELQINLDFLKIFAGF